MLYNKLWELAVGADWHLALAVGTVIVSVMIWSRIRIRKSKRTIENRLSKIEAQLSKMQNEIDTILQIQVPLVTRLSAKSGAKIAPANVTVETCGCDVAELRTSPHTMPTQSEITNSAG